MKYENQTKNATGITLIKLISFKDTLHKLLRIMTNYSAQIYCEIIYTFINLNRIYF